MPQNSSPFGGCAGRDLPLCALLLYDDILRLGDELPALGMMLGGLAAPPALFCFTNFFLTFTFPVTAELEAGSSRAGRRPKSMRHNSTHRNLCDACTCYYAGCCQLCGCSTTTICRYALGQVSNSNLYYEDHVDVNRGDEEVESRRKLDVLELTLPSPPSSSQALLVLQYDLPKSDAAHRLGRAPITVHGEAGLRLGRDRPGLRPPHLLPTVSWKTICTAAAYNVSSTTSAHAAPARLRGYG